MFDHKRWEEVRRATAAAITFRCNKVGTQPPSAEHYGKPSTGEGKGDPANPLTAKGWDDATTTPDDETLTDRDGVLTKSGSPTEAPLKTELTVAPSSSTAAHEKLTVASPSSTAAVVKEGGFRRQLREMNERIDGLDQQLREEAAERG
ncbi:unnamed protein product [Linum trigynum]|uniref:Uncharacterized protein n=1 Tax=Linum trigynum TaxID=586398 RepID=A0AAV2CS20_9ROSI